MKYILLTSTLVLLLISSVTGQKAAPPGMRYQAIARDIDGNIRASQPLEVKAELVLLEAGEEVVYEEFHQAAKELLNEHGYDEKGLGIVEKARTYFMINLQTMTDPSASHIASMLITGSSMGIVEAIQKYRQYEDADPKIRDLMDKLRKFEEHNMEKLKDFL